MNKMLLTLGAGMLLPMAAVAGPSYNYIQADYVADGSIEPEGDQNSDYNGYAVKFSGALTPNVFLQGSHEALDIDGAEADLDINAIRLGGNGSIIDNGRSSLDIYGAVSYELLNDALDANGFGVDVGLRYLPIEQIEIRPFVGYVDYGELDNTGSVDVDMDGLRYGLELVGQVYRNVSVTASYRQRNFELTGDGNADLDFSDEIRVGLRVDL